MGLIDRVLDRIRRDSDHDSGYERSEPSKRSTIKNSNRERSRRSRFPDPKEPPNNKGIGEPRSVLADPALLHDVEPEFYLQEEEDVEICLKAASPIEIGDEEPVKSKSSSNREIPVILTDKRVLVIIGQKDGNRPHSLSYSDITKIDIFPLDRHGNGPKEISDTTVEFKPIFKFDAQHRYQFRSETLLNEDDILYIGDFICRRSPTGPWSSESWWRHKRIRRGQTRNQ